MTPTRRTVALGFGWVVLTALAIFVAWRGVGVVADEVVGERPSDLSADDIDAALAAADSTTSTAGSSTSSDASTSSTAGGSTSTSVAPGATTSTTAPTSIVRTYEMVGGTAQVRFTATAVTVVYARPNSGFEVDADQQSPTSIRVEFESDEHRSRLDASWSGGPVDEVREDDDDGSGGPG